MSLRTLGPEMWPVNTHFLIVGHKWKILDPKSNPLKRKDCNVMNPQITGLGDQPRKCVLGAPLLSLAWQATLLCDLLKKVPVCPAAHEGSWEEQLHSSDAYGPKAQVWHRETAELLRAAGRDSWALCSGQGPGEPSYLKGQWVSMSSGTHCGGKTLWTLMTSGDARSFLFICLLVGSFVFEKDALWFPTVDESIIGGRAWKSSVIPVMWTRKQREGNAGPWVASSFFLFYSAWVPSLWDVASQIWSGSSPHNTLTSQSRWGMRVTRMHSICNHRIIQDNSVNKVVFSFHVKCSLSTHNSFFTLSSHLFSRLV